MNCGKCGSPLEVGATFCNSCGAPVAQTTSSNGTKKGGSKIVLIIILLILFLGIGFGVGFFVGKGSVEEKKCDSKASKLSSNDKEEEKEEEKKEEEKTDTDSEKKPTSIKLDVSNIKSSGENEYGNKISIEKLYYDDEHNYLYALAKNNNSVAIDYTIYLNYMDSTNTRVDRALSMGYVDPGKYFVVKLWNKTEETYDSTNISIKGSPYKSYYHQVKLDLNKISVDKTENSIKASYKNDTKNELNVSLCIIYYKNNEIVFFDYGNFIAVKPGIAADVNFSIYNLPGYSFDKHDPANYYDKYDVVLSSAYYYDKEY